MIHLGDIKGVPVTTLGLDPEDVKTKTSRTGAGPELGQQLLPLVEDSASKSSIRRFVIMEKAPTRAFSWLKAATTAFTFKTLLRHNAKQALTPR